MTSQCEICKLPNNSNLNNLRLTEVSAISSGIFEKIMGGVSKKSNEPGIPKSLYQLVKKITLNDVNSKKNVNSKGSLAKNNNDLTSRFGKYRMTLCSVCLYSLFSSYVIISQNQHSNDVQFFNEEGDRTEKCKNVTFLNIKSLCQVFGIDVTTFYNSLFPRTLNFNVDKRSFSQKFKNEQTSHKGSLELCIVRHGQSGANVAKNHSYQKMWLTPLLSLSGILQSHYFGKNILPKILEKSPDKTPEFYSSFLPRACMTAMLISQGYSESAKGKRKGTPPHVKGRIGHISEIQNFAERPTMSIKTTGRTTTKTHSHMFCAILNNLLKAQIKTDLALLHNGFPCVYDELDPIITTKDSIAYFLMMAPIIFSDSVKANTLPVIASHGACMKQLVKLIVSKKTSIYEDKEHKDLPSHRKDKYINYDKGIKDKDLTMFLEQPRNLESIIIRWDGENWFLKDLVLGAGGTPHFNNHKLLREHLTPEECLYSIPFNGHKPKFNYSTYWGDNPCLQRIVPNVVTRKDAILGDPAVRRAQESLLDTSINKKVNQKEVKTPDKKTKINPCNFKPNKTNIFEEIISTRLAVLYDDKKKAKKILTEEINIQQKINSIRKIKHIKVEEKDLDLLYDDNDEAIGAEQILILQILQGNNNDKNNNNTPKKSNNNDKNTPKKSNNNNNNDKNTPKILVFLEGLMKPLEEIEKEFTKKTPFRVLYEFKEDFTARIPISKIKQIDIPNQKQNLLIVTVAGIRSKDLSYDDVTLNIKVNKHVKGDSKWAEDAKNKLIELENQFGDKLKNKTYLPQHEAWKKFMTGLYDWDGGDRASFGLVGTLNQKQVWFFCKNGQTVIDLASKYVKLKGIPVDELIVEQTLPKIISVEKQKKLSGLNDDPLWGASLMEKSPPYPFNRIQEIRSKLISTKKLSIKYLKEDTIVYDITERLQRLNTITKLKETIINQMMMPYKMKGGGNKSIGVNPIKKTPAGKNTPTRKKTPSTPTRKKTPSTPTRKKTPSTPTRKKTPSTPTRKKTHSTPARKKTPSTPTRKKTPSTPARKKTPSTSTPARKKTPSTSTPARKKTPSTPARKKTPATKKIPTTKTTPVRRKHP